MRRHWTYYRDALHGGRRVLAVRRDDDGQGYRVRYLHITGQPETHHLGAFERPAYLWWCSKAEALQHAGVSEEAP